MIFGGLRTGRASTSLLDPVTVEVYGAHMPITQLATVSAPEPRMLSVQVWDKSNVGPVGQGDPLGWPRPQPDRRRPDAAPADPRPDRGAPQGAGQAGRPICREGQDRGAQRAPRRHGRLKTDEKKHGLSEDERKRHETDVQKATDATIAEIDAAFAAKEKEILGK